MKKTLFILTQVIFTTVISSKAQVFTFENYDIKLNLNIIKSDSLMTVRYSIYNLSINDILLPSSGIIVGEMNKYIYIDLSAFPISRYVQGGIASIEKIRSKDSIFLTCSSKINDYHKRVKIYLDGIKVSTKDTKALYKKISVDAIDKKSLNINYADYIWYKNIFLSIEIPELK